MIPLADDVQRTRKPVVTLVLSVAAAGAALAALFAGDGIWTVLLLAACALWIWVFGRSVEDAIGPVWFVLLALVGGAGAVMIGIAAGMDGRYAAAAASGVALEVVVAHLLRFRDVRILCLVPVPVVARIVETPAWPWALTGAALLVLLGAAGAYGA